MAESKDRRVSHERALDAAERLKELRTGIVLTGRVVNGKVELDEATLQEIARNFPDAEMSFVAVNAPFDPETQPV